MANAWSAILHVFFPDRAPMPDGVKYDIPREAYRGPNPKRLSKTRPDIIVVKSAPGEDDENRLRRQRRDILWVQCKAPCSDRPSQWKTLIEEAAGRIKAAHLNRMVYIIVAIGSKWTRIVFKWDPQNQQPRLQVLAHDRGSAWEIMDARIANVPIHNQSPVIQLKPGDPFDLIDTEQAFSLADAQGRQRLETFLVGIRSAHFLGSNPGYFH